MEKTTEEEAIRQSAKKDERLARLCCLGAICEFHGLQTYSEPPPSEGRLHIGKRFEVEVRATESMLVLEGPRDRWIEA